MTQLDLFVFKAVRQAYNHGYVDALDGVMDGCESCLYDILICPEYVELTQEPVRQQALNLNGLELTETDHEAESEPGPVADDADQDLHQE